MMLDLLVGLVLLGSAWELRRLPVLALLATLSGMLWFLGDLVEPLVFAHRAPLTQLLLLYPGTRFRSRSQRWVVGAIWLVTFIYPVGRVGAVTVLAFVLVVVAAFLGLPSSRTAVLRSALIARAGVTFLWGCLVAAALVRWQGAHADRSLLSAYEVTVALAVAAVMVDLRYRASHGAVVTNLAVDLGAASGRSLRDIIAAALGDPSVVLALPGATGLTDEAGRPVALSGASGQVWTDLLDGDHRIAVLRHDPALLRDRRLLDSVTALAAVAVANIRLEQDVAASIVEVDASRRRLLAVGDAERSRLERELQASVLSRLADVAALVRALGLSDLSRQVDAARDTIRSFAQGVYPRALDERGLTALGDLEQFRGWVTFDVPDTRFPRDIEAAAYFLCVEALTNVVKYAHATTANVSVSTVRGMLVVEVTDDGIGGAEPTQGTGLLGLRDRLEVLGGWLTVDSPGTGTRVLGHIPLVCD